MFRNYTQLQQLRAKAFKAFNAADADGSGDLDRVRCYFLLIFFHDGIICTFLFLFLESCLRCNSLSFVVVVVVVVAAAYY